MTVFVTSTPTSRLAIPSTSSYLRMPMPRNLVRGERSGRRAFASASRTAYAMLVILVLAMVWQVLGSL